MVVIASDGVWEFLSNELVASIVFPFWLSRSATAASETLMREAHKRWKREENGTVDDITCIVVFLNIPA